MKCCMYKFFKVLGAGVGANLAAVYVGGMYASDWKSLAYLLYGICAGMIVAWIVSLGFKEEETKPKKKK